MRVTTMMKLSDRGWKRFAFFLASQMLSFFVICANFRALAQGLYFWTAFTDAMIVFQNMMIAKLFIENENARDKWCIAGATIGGVLGSILSIYVTKHVF